jgi:ABC-type antimicrobial peptide transport system permease subunit
MDFMGKTFMVSKVHGERGSKDDITIWMNLGECQELLDKKGEINAIQALECNCATVDRLGEIRAELLKILPGTKIIETQSTALARAEARVNAKKLADKELADRRLERDALARELESLMGVLAPLITLFCIGVVSLLAFLNVRDRLSEIGILRAIGVGRGKLVLVFLLRAIFAGLAGGGLALVFVWLAVEVIRMDVLGGYSFGNLYTGSQVGAVLILAPLFAALAAWVPGLFAAQKDPAVVLRYD